MRPVIEVWAKSELAPERQRELECWFQHEFGHTSIEWAEPDWYVVTMVGSDMASRLGIVERVVLVDGQSVAVGGISGVVTRPEWRCQGLASQILQEAVTFIQSSLYLDFALLLCRPEVAPVYARNGWQRVDGPTIFQQSSGQRTYAHLTMNLSSG